jgi:IstB-like ATP binding protein
MARPTIADAILDRIIHNSHRIALEGDSIRRKKAARPLTDVENSETNTQLTSTTRQPKASSATLSAI